MSGFVARQDHQEPAFQVGSFCWFFRTLPARFINAIVLSVLFFLTVFSLIGVEQDAASAWTDIHIWAGGLMLIGAAVHLMTNLDWVRAVFLRPSKSLNLQTRRNKRTDLVLFITV